MKSYTLDYNSYVLNENSDKEEKRMITLSSLVEYLNVLKQIPEYALPIFRGTGYFNSGTPIYSFEYETNDVYMSYVKPLESRNSLTSVNYGYDTMWNLWFANNSEWKKYPSRKHDANICTTNFNKANRYGACNIVIPVNIKNTKFGICAKSDLFESFSETEYNYGFNIKEFCDFFTEMLDNVQKLKKKKYFKIDELYKSKEEILDVFNYLEKYFIELTNNKKFDIDDEYLKQISWFSVYEFQLFKKIYLFYKDSSNTILNLFTEMLNPEKNGFTLSKDITNLLFKIKKNNLKDNEIWFNGDYIGINLNNNQLYYEFTQNPDSYIKFIEQTISNLQNI